MQKAFDKVNLVVLFKKLIPRDIPFFDLYYMLSLCARVLEWLYVLTIYFI